MRQTAKSTRQRDGRRRIDKGRTSHLWLWGASIATLLLLGLLFWLPSIRGWSARIVGIQTYANLAREHRPGPIQYPTTPPAGGAHNSTWQNCGVYDQPIADEQAVHSLEHGAVWVAYQPELPIAEIEQLRTLVQETGFALLAPYTDLPAPIVATAWGVQLRVEEMGDLRLRQFIAEYSQGPQTPELGAPCTGGSGAPLVR